MENKNSFIPSAPDESLDNYVSTGAFYPLRFLGLGLFIVWLSCTHIVNISPGPHNDPANLRFIFDYGMRTGDIATFLILALFFNKIGRISRHRTSLIWVVSLTAVGTAFVNLYLMPYAASIPFVFIASFFTAIGGAFLFCLWAEIYSQMVNMQEVVYAAGSCVAAALVAFIINTMAQPYCIFATSLMPLLSLFCAFLSLKMVPEELPHSPKTYYPLPWKLIVIMFLGAFASGLVGILVNNPADVGAAHRIQATGLAGALILIVIFFRRERWSAHLIAMVALPLALIAFLLIPFAYNNEFVSLAVSFLIKSAYIWFTFFVLLILSFTVQRFSAPSLKTFAVARASSEGALVLGLILRRGISADDFLENPFMGYGILLAGVLLLFCCVLIWRSEESVTTDWGISSVNLTSGLHVPTEQEQFIQRCATLAERYELTQRETEIFQMIAKGKTRAEIEQALFLSKNTVKTHVRHIYTKLDIHSKDEVLKLF